MSLNYVELTLDLYDGRGNPVEIGTATLVPTAVLTDATDHQLIGTGPISVPFSGQLAGTMPPVVKLLATDNTNVSPSGWAWTITPPAYTGIAAFSFFLPYSGGASQYLSDLAPVVSPTTYQAYMPLPTGTATSGYVPIATGSGEISAWGPQSGGGGGNTGVTVTVAAPTGATATDTPHVTAAIASLVSALASGPATLLFQDGTYQIDSNEAVIQSVSNFTVTTSGRTIITQAPNRSSLPNNTTGDLFVIADSTDFRVEGITFDCLRDTNAPLTPLTASASSGQPSVTVASGNGARYQAGQNLAIFGGLGSSDQNLFEGFAGGGGKQPLVISSITAGGGTGGGDLITFTTNLANSYTQTGGSAVSDGFGPYAWTSDYLTPYQVGWNNTVAGRTLGGEDQQNALHLLNCQRFVVSRVTGRNTWESQIKCGTGFASSSLTDGCQQGSIADCISYHGYDQGVSLWVSKNISVTGCVTNASGWTGISMSGSDDCAVVGNQSLNHVYQIPGDLNNGFGIAIEGGLHNQVKGNIIAGTYCAGIELDASPMPWGTFNTSAPTLAAFVEELTAGGTSIHVSSSANLEVGGLYSIIDGPRTEAVTVASVVDGTHVTFRETLWFSHASGLYICARAGQENVIEGNTIYGSQFGAAIVGGGATRTVIKDNIIHNWAGLTTTGDGISLIYSKAEAWPSGVYLGGDGSHIEGNIIGGSGYSSGHCIHADSVTGLQIRGNRLYGGGTNAALMYLQGVTDSIVTGNFLSDSNNAGLSAYTGTESATVPARLTIDGNRVMRCGSAGIFLQYGDSLTVTSNVVSSCGGNAGIDLQGITNSVVDGNIANSNQAAGILLENNAGSVGCSACRVTNNTARDDGSGYNVKTGATWTQAYGIRETGASNNNLITGNECDANATGQIATVGAATYSWANVLSGAVAAGTSPNGGGASGDTNAAHIGPDGTQTAGSNGLYADSGHVHPAVVGVTPGDLGLLTMNFDPIVPTTGATVAGTLYLLKLFIRESMTITNIVLSQTGNGGGASTGSYVGLYSSSGTLLSGSSDIGATLTGGAGNKTLALTTPQAVTAGTFVWVALLVNLASTQPTLAKSMANATSANVGTTATTYRIATNGTSLTALPSPSITPSSNSQATALPFWVGVS